MAIFILGGHQTDFARVWSREGLDISDMLRDAVDGTLAAARLEPEDIDSVHVGNAFGELYRGQGHLAAMVAQVQPRLHGKPAMRHEAACASSSLAILAATAELEAGRYDCILVAGVEEEKNLPGDQASRVQNAASWQGHEGLDCQFIWPAVFGRVAMEYEARYGLDRRYLNRIAQINMPVVVVLPWVPAIAMPCFRRISSASITARGTSGMRRARAARTSGLSPFTAVDVTTASAPAMFSAAWPMATRTPSAARRCVTAPSLWSEPLTR